MEIITNISQSLIDSIAAENITDVLLEIADAEIHTLLDNELLKDIPYFGLFAKAVSVGRRISDAIFTRKVLDFLRSANSASKEKKKTFRDKMDKDPETKKRVGDSLIVLLDRMDDISKCGLLGNLFRAYLDSKIDYSTFLRLASMLDKVFLPDLILLRHGHLVSIDDSVKDLLVLSGVVKSTVRDQRKWEEHIRQQIGTSNVTAPIQYDYSLTNFGNFLLNFAFYKSS